MKKDGKVLQRLRVLLELRQKDVAALIPRYDGRGMIDDTTLSRVEGGYLEPTEEFVWLYVAALVAAREALVEAREALVEARKDVSP